MRLRSHLTYANVTATIALFGVLAGGSAYAVSKIDTRDLANGAVTAKKLDAEAVKASKLRPGSVTGEKLADGAVEDRNLSEFAPVALAGVKVLNGDVVSWFSRISDEKPSVTRTGPGVYDLRLPGFDDPGRFSFLEMLSSVSLIDGPPGQAGEATSNWNTCSAGGCLQPTVHTFDSTGTPADRSFVLIVYRAEHTI